MDSLTQIALGAAIGEATLGRRVGYRAALWGGICATLPDLDVFIDFGGAVENFTYHRSFSHSLFVLPLLAPLLVWLILKIHPQTRPQRTGWLWLVLLALVTHPLLDAFTVYGTQLFWPFVDWPVSGSSVFIIDPAFTLPLLAGLGCALLMRRSRPLGHRLNSVGLTLGGLFLAWTVAVKLHVEAVVAPALARQGIAAGPLLTIPAPFTTLLWRVIAIEPDRSGYYEAYYSLFDGQDVDASLRPQRFPSSPELLDGLETHWPVARLRWFTQGFYAVGLEDDEVVMSDLRMGLEPSYVFRFAVAAMADGKVRPRPAERVASARDPAQLGWVWRRIWEPVAPLRLATAPVGPPVTTPSLPAPSPAAVPALR